MMDNDIAAKNGEAESSDRENPDASGATDDDQKKLESPERDTEGRRRRDLRVTLSIRTIALGALIVALVAGLVMMSWLYVDADHALSKAERAAADNRHAEQIALDYATNAAIMNFKDLPAWKTNLVKGTTPELKDKLVKAATSMEQILGPLQWSSTAKPLVAKVRSNTNGAYVVDAFVSVLTKTVQAPDALQSTATYSVTIDSNHDWQISDVGGIGDVLGAK